MTTKGCTASSRRELSEASSLKATGVGETQGETSHRSPRRGSTHQIQLEERVEDVEAQRLPQVAVAEFARGEQERRAMAAAIRVRQSIVGKRGVREGLGWVGLTDPDPSRLGSTSQVGWVGPVGQGPLAYLNQI
jgi:hypothetical protein